MSTMDRSNNKSSIKFLVCPMENFPMWKERVKLYMEAADPRLLQLVEEGPHVPMVASTSYSEVHVPKKLLNLDRKAKRIITNAVDDSTLQIISRCPTAKEMWDSLIILMELCKMEEKSSSEGKGKEEKSFTAKKLKILSDSDSEKSYSAEEAHSGLMALAKEEEQSIIPYDGKVQIYASLSNVETASDSDEGYSSNDESSLREQYEVLLASFDECQQIVKTQSKEISSLKEVESNLRKEIEESTSLREEIQSLKDELAHSTELLEKKEKSINSLKEQLSTERKIVEMYNKPKTVLPIIDTFSAVRTSSGIGAQPTKSLSKSAKRRAAKAKGKAPIEEKFPPIQTSFKKVIFPSNKFDFESSYGHFSRPLPNQFPAESSMANQGWSRPRNFGRSTLKAPYEEITLKGYGPFVHGPSAKKAPKVKPIVAKPCLCCTNEASTSKSAHVARPPVQMVKQVNKRRYNRFDCWCCGKIGHFAIDCWFNQINYRTPQLNNARPTHRNVNVPRGVALTRNLGPKPYWAPKGK